MYSSADVITLMPNYFAEKNRAGARFQNELNGMEHMRTGPLLIRQQIVMQVFKDGVPQPPYLYASFKSDNVTEALEHYNECVEDWLNNYPRPMFGGRSSQQLYEEEMRLII